MRRLLALGAATAIAAGLALPGTAAASPVPNTQDGQSASQSPLLGNKVAVIVTLRARADATQAREGALLGQQTQLLKDWSAKYGVEVDRQFGLLVNGFSATMPEGKVAALRAEPQVESVQRQRVFYPALATASEMVQANTVRDELGVDGAGMVVSIIDSGIDPSHQDMRLADFSKAAITDIKPGYTEKVPWGFNFADRNDNVVDADPTQHGMHVAGIVAANGGADASLEENGRVNGMAPEAQLLAMKVFSNDPYRRNQAFESDIVAAVEESVRREADIINMSLGSANGFDSADYGLNRAIETASEQGVFVVIAAGNEGLRSSLDGTDWDLGLYLDNGTVSSPSTTKSAFSVASVENGTVTAPLATGSAEGTSETKSFAYQMQQGAMPTEPVELFDASLGGYADFRDDNGELLEGIEGKFALIKRGEYDFTEKVQNAGDAGAAGVVLWNHEEGGDDVFGAIIESSYDFPVATLGYSSGAFLEGLIADQGNASLSFSAKPVVQSNPAAATPSSFTGWGTTPDLAIKPDIAGIGGNVYSTLNDNKYGNMSGTSMASPQVAGVSALVLSELSDRHPDMERGELNDLMRSALSNTAVPTTDNAGLAYPVRRQGAGLAQAADALATSVVAESDGSPSVALRDFTGTKTFEVTLRNLDGQAQEFSVETPAVLTEEVDANGELNSAVSTCGDSITADKDSVVVPAGGDAVVTFEMTAGGACDSRFVEGWISFASNDADQPDLSMPYMGFVGDWGAEDVLDTGLWGEVFGDEYLKTQLAVNDGWDVYAYDPDEWFTSDAGGTEQLLMPALFSLRNATEIQYELLDTSGAVIQKLGYDREVPAPLMSRVYNGQMSPYTMPDFGFDGLRYDKTTGDYKKAESGEYKVRVKSRVNDSKDWQELEFPFHLDADAPELKVLSAVRDGNDVTMSIQVTDEHSGPVAASREGEIQGLSVATGTGFLVPAAIESAGDHEAIFQVKVTDAAERGWAVFRGADKAGNESAPLTYFFNDNAVIWHNADDYEAGFADGTYSMYMDDYLVQDGRVPMAFTTGSGIATLQVADQSVTPVQGEVTTIWVPFEIGHTDVSVRALDAAGNPRYQHTVDVFYHPFEPTIRDVVAKPVRADLWGTGDEEDALHVTGCVDDQLVPAEDLTVWINGWDATPGVDGCFATDIMDMDWDTGPAPSLVLWYVDNGVTAIAGRAPVDGRAAAATWMDLLKLSNVDLQGGVHFAYHQDPDLIVGDDGAASYKITGRFYASDNIFKIDGEDVEIAQDGTFEHVLALQKGVTSVNVFLATPDGRVVHDAALRVLYSPSLPKLDFEAPTFYEGQLFVPKAERNDVVFKGQISDETFGQTLWINGDMISSFADITAPGETLTRKSFEYSSEMAAGEIISIEILDAISRHETLQIPVVLDDVAPELTAGISDGDVITKPGDVEVRAFDKNLTVLAASVIDTATGDPLDNLSVTYSQDEDGKTAVSTFDPSLLPAGTYLLTATALDAAGNQSDLSVTFHVPGDALVEVEGPDAIEVQEGENVVLGDHWSVPAGYDLVADLDNLQVGDNAVRIQVRDSEGNLVGQRDVVITVVRGLSTLVDNRVSVTARFAPEHRLTATWTQVSEFVEEVRVGHGDEPLEGSYSIEVPQTAGVKVLRVADENNAGRRVLQTEVSYEVVGSSLVFNAHTPATFRIVYPAVPGTGGGAGSGSGSITKPGGDLSNTGAHGVGLFVASGALALAGGAAATLASRKRKAA